MNLGIRIAVRYGWDNELCEVGPESPEVFRVGVECSSGKAQRYAFLFGGVGVSCRVESFVCRE